MTSDAVLECETVTRRYSKGGNVEDAGEAFFIKNSLFFFLVFFFELIRDFEKRLGWFGAFVEGGSIGKG